MTSKELKWPSERICQGGLFHPPKVKYSQETRDLLKILMEEAKLSMLLRKNIDYHLRNGEPLPTTPYSSKYTKSAIQFQSNKEYEKRLKSCLIHRRSYETIKASGAYDNPKYHPLPNLKPSNEEAKIQLQEKMSGMKIYSDDFKIKSKLKKDKEIDLDINKQIDELLEEIFERDEWLKEMETLGEGKKYRPMIQSQIQEKLREIKILERRRNALQK